MKKIAEYLLFFIIGVTLLGGCEKEQLEKPEVVRPVRAIQVGDAAALHETYLPGRARAAQEVDLSFRVAGPLIERPVFVGDKVKQGDLVARIDPRDFQVEVRNREGQLDEAKAAYRRARGEYERELNIFRQDPGATSKTAVDRKREERDRAQAAIKSLEAGVAAAQDRLSYTYLESPFDGSIVTTYVENFQSVRAKQSIVRILNTQRIKFDIDIPEKWISYVPHATNIRVQFDVFPDKEVAAELFEIGTEASQTTRTYPVTVIMDQPEGFEILPGMAGRVIADAEAPVAELYGDIVIPANAVFSSERGEKSFIWVIEEATGTVSRREVVSTLLGDTGVVIKEGVKPGEWIATAGVHFLKEGQKVRIIEPPGA